MAKVTEEQLAELKSKHSFELHHLVAETGHEVVVRSPSRAAWHKFQEAGFHERKRARALESLLIDCLIHPSRQELDAMLEDKPGLAETFGARLMKLAGAGVEVDKG